MYCTTAAQFANIGIPRVYFNAVARLVEVPR
jgi:hypothetical protein